MYHCEYCTAVFTTRRQWRRHTRVHFRFFCRKCEYLCTNYATHCRALSYHFYTDRLSEASLATRALTPSKHCIKRVVSYAEYKAARLEDQLRLLESSDDNESGNDPRSQQ